MLLCARGIHIRVTAYTINPTITAPIATIIISAIYKLNIIIFILDILGLDILNINMTSSYITINNICTY